MLMLSKIVYMCSAKVMEKYKKKKESREMIHIWACRKKVVPFQKVIAIVW